MKKTLFFLIFLLSIGASAQINQNVTPYQICNNSNSSQFDVFDLTSKIPEILNGLNPADHTVTFHETLTDAQIFGNAIFNPTAYLNVNNPMTIFARVAQNQTNIAEITSFQLMVFQQVTAYPAVLSFCDTMELPLYNLSDADNQITAGITGATVSYFLTLADAQANTSPIVNTYIPIISPGTQILYARVQSQATSCFNITTLSLNTHNCQPCQTPSLLTSSGVTHNSASLNWVENGTATTWEIVALPSGSPAPTAGTVPTVIIPSFPYNLNGLTSNTIYDVYVRSACSANVKSDWSGVTTFTTAIAPPGCGGTFTDEGGLAANYPNNSNRTTIICPDIPGESVFVTFTSFNTEANHDAMYVYMGNAAIPSNMIPSSEPGGNIPGGLPGGYSGNTIPGPFASTSPDGCLTFVFKSDSSNTSAGWNANVFCSTQTCEAPVVAPVAFVTSTSVLLNWSNPSNSGAWQVFIVPQGAPQPPPGLPGTFVQSLPYVATGLTPGDCYDVYVRAVCSTLSDLSSPLNFCMINCEDNADCADSLALIAFVDSNNNGIKDNGETNFSYGSFVYEVNNSGVPQFGSTNGAPYSIFDLNPANSYDINFSLNGGLEPYYTSSVTYSNITIPAGSGTNTLYFPIVNIQPHVDARVNLYGGAPRPGFTYTVSIYYQNHGSQTIPSGTVTFTQDAQLTINGISDPNAVTTATGFTCDFTNLQPFESRYITVTLLVPTIPTISLGDLVTNTASILINNDIDLSNNNTFITQVVVGSYDPNDKMESHGGKIVHANFTAADYLYYTIQFENTGTANAEFIRVEDVLNNQLDETSFEMISSSHSVNTKREGNELTWHFYNINLPPTSLNPAQSHGYVSFRIKPKTGYAIGDIIPNTASIFFDYNPAIVTNTFNTEFVQSMGNATFDNQSISVSPNPATNLITITNSTALEKISKVSVYDITGKMIYTLNDHNTFNAITIDVSHFAKGIYLIELTSDVNSKITKKLILK
jgi:hypothetical protein